MAGSSDKPCPGLVYSIIGLWLQFMIYGGYLSLFLRSFPTLVQNWHRTKVFVIGSGVLFLLVSFDTSIKSYTFLVGGMRQLSQGTAITCALGRWGRWDTFTSAVTLNLVIWVTDSLLIYRCFIIWGRNWIVVILPCIILGISMTINSIILVWFSNPQLTDLLPTVEFLLKFCYPVSLALNVLTTGLIAYPILRQHWESKARGVRSDSGISLVYVTRVVIESALIYTLQIFTLSVLHQIGHPAITIFQTTLTPSASITFSLIVVRVSQAKDGESTDLGSKFKFQTQDTDCAVQSPELCLELLTVNSGLKKGIEDNTT